MESLCTESYASYLSIPGQPSKYEHKTVPMRSREVEIAQKVKGVKEIDMLHD
jgi:hypothetical protein